jgi:hypothetical protein
MSQVQAMDSTPALLHEHEVVAPSLDGKAPHSQSLPVVDEESEPIVTRKELWSYYRMSRGIPHSREWFEQLFSVL